MVIRCAVMEAAKDMPYRLPVWAATFNSIAAGILAYPSSNPVLGGLRSYDCYQWR